MWPDPGSGGVLLLPCRNRPLGSTRILHSSTGCSQCYHEGLTKQRKPSDGLTLDHHPSWTLNKKSFVFWSCLNALKLYYSRRNRIQTHLGDQCTHLQVERGRTISLTAHNISKHYIKSLRETAENLDTSKWNTPNVNVWATKNSGQKDCLGEVIVCFSSEFSYSSFITSHITQLYIFSENRCHHFSPIKLFVVQHLRVPVKKVVPALCFIPLHVPTSCRSKKIACQENFFCCHFHFDRRKIGSPNQVRGPEKIDRAVKYNTMIHGISSTRC